MILLFTISRTWLENALTRTQGAFVSGSSTSTPPDIVTAVHKVIKDVERRKCIVMISDLRPISDVNDDSLFKSLCERYFSVVPSIIRSRRIDKMNSSPGAKPSRFLVQLGSKATASEILAQAHQLHLSSDEHVKLNVYVSRDMSPEEAKLAYEERTRRRQKRLKSLSDDGPKSRSCADVNPPSDIPTTRLTRSRGQQVSVSSVASVVPQLNDAMQFPPLDSNCPSVSTLQDKQPGASFQLFLGGAKFFFYFSMPPDY